MEWHLHHHHHHHHHLYNTEQTLFKTCYLSSCWITTLKYYLNKTMIVLNTADSCLIPVRRKFKLIFQILFELRVKLIPLNNIVNVDVCMKTYNQFCWKQFGCIFDGGNLSFPYNQCGRFNLQIRIGFRVNFIPLINNTNFQVCMKTYNQVFRKQFGYMFDGGH